MLERADDGVVGAFQNADDAALGAGVPALGPAVAFIARDAGHDAIAVHGGAGVLGRDEEILFARFVFLREEGVAGLMNVEQAGDEVGFGGEDVAILPDAGDLAGAFHFAQGLVQIHAHAAFAPEGFGQLGFVERAVFRRAQEAEDAFLKGLGLGIHRGQCPREGVWKRAIVASARSSPPFDEYCASGVSLNIACPRRSGKLLARRSISRAARSSWAC